MSGNLAARLLERAAQHPGRVAIVECRGSRTRRVTFSELAASVTAWSAHLRERGVQPGDSVLLFVPMSIALYAVLLAVFHAGAVAVFVDAWADGRRLEAAVKRTRPRAFIGVARAHLLRLGSGAVRSIPIAIVVGNEPPKRRTSREAGPVELTAGAPALVTFTTGSTGEPKAAVRSHAFLWSQHLALADHLRLRGTDIDMPTLPIFVLNNLAMGIPSVIPDFDPRRPGEIDAQRIREQMAREHVTTSSGSPAFYARLAEWCSAHATTLPLRAVFTGGAPVLPPLVRALGKLVQEVHVVYGSTEAEPIAGIAGDEMLAAMGDGREEGLCVGREVTTVEVKLIQPHDDPVELGARGWGEWEVPRGEVGELVVTGAHVLTGYLDDPAAERACKIRDGDRVWHRTGDAAHRDGQGRLWLMGRMGQRVRRAGVTWWPEPAELDALEVEGVSHCAYFGMPDPLLGERAVLCVEAARADPERLRGAIAPAPADDIHVVGHIPRDPRHDSKTDLATLRRRLARH